MRTAVRHKPRLSHRWSSSSPKEPQNLRKTPLHTVHLSQNAKMVPFGDWELPLEYPHAKTLASVSHTRTKASVFDVSHMVQTRIRGNDRVRFMEQMFVAGVGTLKENQGCYSLMTNDSGGIVDDVIIMFNAPHNDEDHHVVVLNAGCRKKDISHLRSYLEEFQGECTLEVVEDRALLALQGPSADAVLKSLMEPLHRDRVNDLYFFDATTETIAGIDDVFITRTGYTGEDGFELSVPSDRAVHLMETLLGHEDVLPSGLAARDVLRLEAGLCLYGKDLDETITPIEAGLLWTIPKTRREYGGFLGSEVVLRQIQEGVDRRRVGLVCQGAPAREYAEILDIEGTPRGGVTSGTFSPTLGKPIAMGFVERGFTKQGTLLKTVVRDKEFDAEIVKLPFVPNNYRMRPRVIREEERVAA